MMNKEKYFLISFLVLIFTFPPKVDAQAISDWKLQMLDVAGRTNVNGVEVYVQTSTCKNEIVVLIKFVNHNAYPVTVKWFDAVQTQAHEWIKNDDPALKKSQAIDANSEIKGDCLTNTYLECIVNIKDLIGKQNKFSEYTIYHFEAAPL